MKYFKKIVPYSELSFIEVIYYAVICPLCIGYTAVISLLITLCLITKFNFDFIYLLITFAILFLLFFRNIFQIIKMYGLGE